MSDYSSELQHFAEKLQRQREGIDKILNMNSYGLITEETSGKLREARERAQHLENKLRTGEFEVAIIGEEKAGKSSFVNAIMGGDILPTKEERCTYTSTSVRYGDKDHAEVSFYGDMEFSQGFQDRLRIMGYPHYDTQTCGNLSLAQYRSVFESLDEKTRAFYGPTVNKDVENILEYWETLRQFTGHAPISFEGGELREQTFKRFIEDPRYAIAVKEIVLHTTQLGGDMRNAVIYDVPGFNSPTKMHKEQTIEKMCAADAILFVAGADKPSLTDASLDIFSKNVDEDNIVLGDKLFVFANKADRTESLQENMQVIRREMERYHIMKKQYFDVRIIPGSAKARLLLEKRDPEAEHLQEALRRRGIDDGVKTIIGRLGEYNQGERFDVLKRRAIRVGEIIRSAIESMNAAAAEENAFLLNGPDFLMESEKTKVHIEHNLEDYREQLKTAFVETEKPLTQKLLAEVICHINAEELGVSDEEMTRCRRKTDTTAENTEDFNRELRKIVRPRIYNRFLTEIVDIALEEHANCDREIEKIYMSAMDIRPGDVTYDELLKQTRAYLQEHRYIAAPAGYYNSLVFRFSDDLFEILLGYKLGSHARWDMYCNRARVNFESLAVFDESYDRTKGPEQQALPRKLLYQQIPTRNAPRMGTSDMDDRLLEMAEDILEAVPDQEITVALRTLRQTRGEEAISILGRIHLTKVDKAWRKNRLLQKITAELSQSAEGTDLGGMEEDPLSLDYYKSYFANKEERYAMVREEVDADINVLQNVLETTLVHALCIEKPFYELERQTINKLIDTIIGISVHMKNHKKYRK